jgi:hypothetical protein
VAWSVEIFSAEAWKRCVSFTSQPPILIGLIRAQVKLEKVTSSPIVIQPLITEIPPTRTVTIPKALDSESITGM